MQFLEPAHETEIDFAALASNDTLAKAPLLTVDTLPAAAYCGREESGVGRAATRKGERLWRPS